MNKVSLQHPYKIAELAAGKVQSNSPAGKRQALGDITFSLIPIAAETLTINGTVFTLIAHGATPVGNQIALGTDLTTTIDAAVTALNASAVAGVALAAYSNVGGTKLHVKSKAYGTAGNAFTLAETSTVATASGATLTGGLDADNFITYQDNALSAETKALSTVAGTTVTEWDLPAGEEGQETTYYLAVLGAGSNAQVNGAFAGGLTKLTFDTVGKAAKLKFLGASWVPIANTGALS